MDENIITDENEKLSHEEIFGEDETDNYVYYQPYENHFEEYIEEPFHSFKSGICQETEEVIFNNFMEWLLICQTEGFLYTFEPNPTLTQMTLGKCPYFHTGLTCEEKLAQMKKAEQDEKMRQELEEFLRKRLRLIQRLLHVYKKAKRGIEEEYLKNVSKKDPYCDCKRKVASKRIVDMMIKQFALEYLYLKSLKVKKEIETINCYLIDTDRMRHLKNIHKYTLRTAEKLRLILEKECNDDNETYEKFFEENTLKDMARMYLNEIENMAASVPYFSGEEWSSEHFWEGTSSSEGIPPDYECLSDLIENKIFQGDISKGSEATSEDVAVEDSAFTSDKDDNMEFDSKILSEEDGMSSKKPDSYSGIGEEIFRPALEPEDSQNVIEEIKREILKPFYFLEEEEAETAVPEVHEEKSDEELKRLAQLELNKSELELLEEFKRELWLMDCFNFYTTKIRPDLCGKLKLVHEKSIFDDLFAHPVNTDETSTVATESSLDSDLNKCLTYLNRQTDMNTEGLLKRKPLLDDKESDQIVSVLQGDPSTEYLKKNLEGLSLESEGFKHEYIEPVPEDTTKRPPTESFNTYSDYMNDRSLIAMKSSLQGLGMRSQVSYPSEVGRDSGNVHFISISLSGSLSKEEERDLKLNTSSISVFNEMPKSSKSSENDSILSRGLSIPSFSGSLPDPLKTYEKCIRERQMNISDDNEYPYDIFDTDQLAMRVATEGEQKHESDMSIGTLRSRLENVSVASETLNPGNQDKIIDSNISLYKKSLNDTDAQSSETKPKVCFPTLIEIMDHFTKSLKGHSISSCEASEQGSSLKEEELDIDWNDLMSIKWSCPSEKRAKEKLVECEFDTSSFLDKLKKSNKQYMSNHPEMSAIISLILREITMKRPKNEFVSFIRDTVFDKNFAKKLSSFLTVNSKAYRRRKGIDLNECGKGLKTQPLSLFSFDLPSSEYWREWGVDYKNISEKFGPQTDGLVCEEESYEETDVHKDPWDLARILQDLGTEHKGTGKSTNVCGEWSKLTKSMLRKETRDLKKEAICVTALSNEIDWGELPDLRSSCQKLYTKRIIINKKGNLKKT